MMSFKQQIKHNFGRAANQYEQHAHLQERVASKLAKEIPVGELVLDIGCGTGFLAQLSKRNLIQLDIAYPMCKQALRHGSAINAEMEQLPFRDSSFDAIVSSLTFQWAENETTLLQEVHRVLKPNGKLVFTTLGAATFSNNDFPHNDFRSASHLQQQLYQAGFTIISIETEIEKESFANTYQLLKAIKAIGANTREKNNKKPVARSDLAALKGKPIEANWEVLYVSAKKQ